MRHHIPLVFALLVLLGSCSPDKKRGPEADPSTFSILDFGAKGDSATLNTKAVQAAIDAAYANGGGKVYVPTGNFIIGTIFLKDNVTLYVEAGAKLLGSANIEDYTEMTWGHNKDRQPYHLIVVQDAQNVAIEGRGLIDGRGENFWQNPDIDPDKPQWILAKDLKVSPLIEVIGSKNITIRDVTVKTGGGWNIHTFNSELIKIQGVNIDNSLFSPNSDGIDITGCSDVVVSDCYIRTCDDGVCVKTTPKSNIVERVTVTNCIIQTSCVALKAGCNESFYDMRDITFSNCVIDKSHRAIGLYTREGAVIENITISNITANTNAPITIPLPIHLMAEKKIDSSTSGGGIRNVSISNFQCNTQGRIMMTAADGCFMENITLRDVNLTYPYIEDPSPFMREKMSSQFPKADDVPGALAAKSVIVAQNVKNLVIDNLQTNWPDPGKRVPEKWRLQNKVQNGVLETFEVQYGNTHQAEYSVVWGRNLEGGYLRLPMASPSHPSVPKLNLENSSIRVFNE